MDLSRDRLILSIYVCTIYTRPLVQYCTVSPTNQATTRTISALKSSKLIHKFVPTNLVNPRLVFLHTRFHYRSFSTSLSPLIYESQGSSAGMATDWTAGVWFPVGVRIFSLLHSIHNRLWGPPSLLSNGYRGLFLWGKAAGGGADHSPPSSAEVKNTWIYTSTPPYVFMA
jgi:hypothetical protein